MLKKMWDSTKPPTFKTEEDNRLAYLLHFTILTLIMGSFAGAVVSFIFGFYQTGSALIIGLGGTAMAFSLMKMAHLKPAIWTMLLSFVVTLLFVFMLGDGSHDITILLFPICIMVAALMLGKRSLIVFTFIMIITLQTVILAEYYGMINTRLSEYTLIHDSVSVLIILSIGAFLAFLLSNSIKVALVRSRINERALKENNLKLEKEIKQNKRIEKVLFESEKKYRTVAEMSRDAIFTVDLKRKFTFLNPTFEFITGYKTEEFMGRSFSDLLTPKESKIAEKMFKVGMEQRATTLYKVYIVSQSGMRIPLELNLSILFSDKGKKVGMLGIARDISNRIEAEKKVVFERKRAEFYLDLLSHDIANIQQGINSAVQLAEYKKDDAEKLNTLMENIGKLSKRSITLLNNVKILSRIKNKELKTEPIELKSVVRESINDVKELFREGDLVISLKEPEKDLRVEASPLISNIFFNLLHNGVKFQSGSTAIIDVEILPRYVDRTVEISIADMGPGIPDEMKEDIFQRHTKGGDTRLSGIGLSLVNELVDRFKGSIRIEDRIEGGSVKGAKFIVTLPLSS